MFNGLRFPLLVLAVVACAEPRAPRVSADSPAPVPSGLEGLPPPEDGISRLVLREAGDTDVAVSVKRKSKGCAELYAVVQALQAGHVVTESHGCLGEKDPSTRTEIFIGPESGRQSYKVALEYSKVDHTVAYTIKRAGGNGFIESQRVVMDVGR